MINESIVAKLFGLEGRTALITGAAAGIGREIAMLFAHAGAKVIGADINEEALSSLVGAINAGGRANQAIGLPLDQGDPSSITTMFQAVRDQAAGLDVLVNCAAIYPFKPFEDVDPAFFDRNIGINLRGVFICTQEAVRIMKRGSGGSIINIASVNAVKACVFDNIHYGAAKAAVNNITISIALEYGSNNIRANSIMPGSIATENAIKSAVGNPPHGLQNEYKLSLRTLLLEMIAPLKRLRGKRLETVARAWGLRLTLSHQRCGGSSRRSRNCEAVFASTPH